VSINDKPGRLTRHCPHQPQLPDLFCNWKQYQPVARELKQIYAAETAELAAKRRAFVPPSVESSERKWIARVRAGVLIENKIEATFLQETGVRF
jgi:hypothetical protein